MTDTNLSVLNSTGATVYLKQSGSGSNGDPNIGHHITDLGSVADVPTATPTVYNLVLTTANTEYSQALPSNCRGFEFQCQTSFDVRYAFVTGKVATPTAPYMTCKAGNAYSSFQLNQGASPSTLYFASAQAAVVVEITAWA